MKILLTGFEPFGRVRSNPSERIVKKFARTVAALQCKPRDTIVAEVLPVEFAAAEKKIRRLIRRVRPDAVLCLGVAAARAEICLERIALNMDDEVSADNAREVRTGRRIVRSAPLAYESTLPITRMLAALKKRGIRARISNHAGTYVCNHVFFVARHETERMREKIPCGLIHVPVAGKARNSPKKREMALNEMVEATQCCIQSITK